MPAIYVTHPDTGESMHLTEAARVIGVSQATVWRRYQAGKRGHELFARPRGQYLRLAEEGEARRQEAQKEAVMRVYCRLVRVRRLGDLGQAMATLTP